MTETTGAQGVVERLDALGDAILRSATQALQRMQRSGLEAMAGAAL